MRSQSGQSDLHGIWALVWRSFVYLPVALAAFVLLLVLMVALLFPPFLGITCLCCGLWWQGVALLMGWGFVIWAWRHFRLIRFLLSSPARGPSL